MPRGLVKFEFVRVFRQKNVNMASFLLTLIVGREEQGDSETPVFGTPFITGIGQIVDSLTFDVNLDMDIPWNASPGVPEGQLFFTVATFAECFNENRAPRRYLASFILQSTQDVEDVDVPEHNIYVIHDACWQLFLRRIRDTSRPITTDFAKEAAGCLYRAFYRMRRHPEGKFAVGNGQQKAYRARAFALSTGYVHTNMPFPDAFLVADPMIDLIPPQLPHAGTGLTSRVLFRNESRPSAPRDILSTLPDEIIIAILTELSSVDVCRIRLASRSVAGRSQPGQLPQSFWASRFEPGREMHFVLPAGLGAVGTNWCGLYEGARNPPDEGSALRYQNRRYIWSALDNIASTVRVLLNSQEVPAWYPRHWPFCDLFPYRAFDLIRAGGKLTPFYCGDDDEYGYGPAYLVFPPCTSKGFDLCLSIIPLGGHRFISGIRILHDEIRHRHLHLGLLVHDAEKTVTFERGDRLCGILVAFVDGGLVGLVFHIRNLYRPEELRKVRIGDLEDMEKRYPPIETHPLNPRDGTSVMGIAVGFDGVKCTSMHLLDFDEDFQYEDVIKHSESAEERLLHTRSSAYGEP